MANNNSAPPSSLAPMSATIHSVSKEASEKKCKWIFSYPLSKERLFKGMFFGSVSSLAQNRNRPIIANDPSSPNVSNTNATKKHWSPFDGFGGYWMTLLVVIALKESKIDTLWTEHSTKTFFLYSQISILSSDLLLRKNLSTRHFWSRTLTRKNKTFISSVKQSGVLWIWKRLQLILLTSQVLSRLINQQLCLVFRCRFAHPSDLLLLVMNNDSMMRHVPLCIIFGSIQFVFIQFRIIHITWVNVDGLF